MSRKSHPSDAAVVPTPVDHVTDQFASAGTTDSVLNELPEPGASRAYGYFRAKEVAERFRDDTDLG